MVVILLVMMSGTDDGDFAGNDGDGGDDGGADDGDFTGNDGDAYSNDCRGDDDCGNNDNGNDVPGQTGS